jgi:beta-glucanase (GH16 family)
MNVERIARVVVGGLLVTGLSAFARCSAPERSWRLTWSDEFDGAAGQSPDPAKWAFDVGVGPNGDGWGNAQWEYDTARPQNASLDGAGNLVITARRESYGGMQYTSARMATKGIFTQERGRFEARIKLPAGQGLWPAFWLLGSDIDACGWPACGELDIMEYRGQDRQVVTGSLHGPSYSGADSLGGTTTLPGGAAFDQDFHVFAVEWTKEWIAWKLDGELWQVVVPAARPAGSAWAFDHPFFVLLNLAVGGNYVGPPDPAIFPQAMIVDYVRVYAEE